jgi:hypothetical protein
VTGRQIEPPRRGKRLMTVLLAEDPGAVEKNSGVPEAVCGVHPGTTQEMKRLEEATRELRRRPLFKQRGRPEKHRHQGAVRLFEILANDRRAGKASN